MGKFVDWKGYRFLIRASAKINEPHRLVIIGSGPDQESKTLLTEAGKQGISDRLILLGQLGREEVACWMRRANVFVLPSIKEPFGPALLEAMACGCQCVAAEAGGPKDLLTTQLTSRRLATLVAPLEEGHPIDEERYVRDLSIAIERHLQKPTSEAERLTISQSVAHMRWSDVYANIRKEYLRVLNS